MDLIKKILNTSNNIKLLLKISIDTCIFVLAPLLSYTINKNTFLEENYLLLVFFASVSIIIYFYSGVYNIISRFISAVSILQIVKATALTHLICLTLIFIFYSLFPVLLILVNFFVTSFLIIFSRFVILFIYKYNKNKIISNNNIIIYGAGDAGAELYSLIKLNNNSNIVAYIDDDKTLHGKTIYDIKIYPISSIKKIINNENVSEVIISIPSVNKKIIKSILLKLENYPVRVKMLPSLSELSSNELTIKDIRDVEIEDILGREPSKPNNDLMTDSLKDQTILVTGAGGSIGHKLCEKIILFKPKKLIILDHSENSLFTATNDLNEINLNLKNSIEIIPLLGSILDKNFIEDIFSKLSIDIAFHCAAYKHVPIVEKNIVTSIRNNFFGTIICAKASKKYEVKKFVLISSDKAVNPENVMGATKRLSEIYLKYLSLDKKNYSKNITSFISVRFGNVIGSSGSVLPIFIDQIKKRQPVTITDLDMTRYFMTISEAAELVIQASAIGGSGDIFVLDMGKPVKIIEIAKKLIRLNGLKLKDKDTDGDIEIKIIGKRDGEKIHEELFYNNNYLKTKHTKILLENENYEFNSSIDSLIFELDKHLNQLQYSEIKDIVKNIIKNYTKNIT
tara:strand:+ start:14650 stop:16518 length:1869 start_codon:yes stop_codon:yes gene_type:complete